MGATMKAEPGAGCRGVGLVKNDNCGEYSYGNARFHVFADAVASLGSKMIISTEPFSLVPNPNQGRFAHYWRTGNDINANWQTILNRIDINDKWAPFAGPGHFNDPGVPLFALLFLVLLLSPPPLLRSLR